MWTDVITQSLQSAWVVVADFLPSFIAAIIVLIVGLIIASILRTIFEKIIGAVRVDSVLRKLGLETFLQRGGLRLNSAGFIGALVYWFFVIVTVLAASDILGLWGLSSFLNEVLLYFPNVIVAVLILVAAILIANFLRSLVRASVASAKLHGAKFLGTLTWWVVVIFGFLAALLQLGVATELVQSVVVGIIAMFALAGGLAFGLGGKEYAASWIAKFRSHTEE
jgi:hypothetical protein